MDLKTGDSGTRSERTSARTGTMGATVAICHHLSWRPRLMMRTLPAHLPGKDRQSDHSVLGSVISHHDLRTLSSMLKVPRSSGLQISTVKMLVLTMPLLTPTSILVK